MPTLEMPEMHCKPSTAQNNRHIPTRPMHDYAWSHNTAPSTLVPQHQVGSLPAEPKPTGARSTPHQANARSRLGAPRGWPRCGDADISAGPPPRGARCVARCLMILQQR